MRPSATRNPKIYLYLRCRKYRFSFSGGTQGAHAVLFPCAPRQYHRACPVVTCTDSAAVLSLRAPSSWAILSRGLWPGAHARPQRALPGWEAPPIVGTFPARQRPFASLPTVAPRPLFTCSVLCLPRYAWLLRPRPSPPSSLRSGGRSSSWPEVGFAAASPLRGLRRVRLWFTSLGP